MSLHDALNGSQADARAGKVGGGVQALENPEQVACIAWIESYAIVLHKKGPFAADAARAEADVGRRSPGGELPGVVEQILQNDLQQPQVAVGAVIRLHHESGLPLRRPLLDTTENG